MLPLDSTQRRAVESETKTVLLSGPPGSGKTHCIAARFEYLLKKRRTPLSSILVLSFSAAPVARLRREIENIIGRSYRELNVHTYHSFSRHILSVYATTPGGDGKKIIAPPAQVTPFKAYLVVKELLRMERKNLKSDLKKTALKDGLARELTDFFGLLAQNLVSSQQFTEMARKLPPRIRDIALLYGAYSAHISRKNWVGAGDSVARAVEILKSDRGFALDLQGTFQHILLDEFQEINPAQLRLTELLASEKVSLLAVGDTDQRIYRFRGSMTDQFERLLHIRPEAESIRLKRSYRLPPQILKAAENLIAQNSETANEGVPITLGEDLTIASYADSIEQAYDVARNIKRRVLDGAPGDNSPEYSNFAVICRSTSKSGPPLEEAFSFYGIPYVLYNSTSFFRHPMARCVAAFIRLLVDSGDDNSLLRVLNIPKFDLHAVSVRRIINEQRGERGQSLFDILKKTAATDTTGDEDIRSKLVDFFTYFEGMQKKAADANCPSAVIHTLMQDLFFGEILSNADVSSGVRDANNLRLLLDVAADIEGVFAGMRNRYTLADFAEHMEHAFAHFSSQQENDPSDELAEGVRILTVHQAKGMEFPFVYLVDATEDYFPRLGRSMSLLDGVSTGQLMNALSALEQDAPAGIFAPELSLGLDEQLREERRLAYVAITRALRGLTVCYTEESKLSDPSQPSPFIQEFLGSEDVSQLEGDATLLRKEPSDTLSQLEAALNTQEIETALREGLGYFGPDSDKRQEISRKIEALGLDATFVCEKSPFEPEQERGIDLSNHVYSASQLANYLTCPRRFYFDRLLRVTPDRPEDFGLGQLIHKTLEHFHKRIRNFEAGKDRLCAAVENSFLAVWNGKDPNDPSEAFREVYPAALQQAAIRQRALQILRRYVETEIVKTPDREIIACEERVMFKVRGYDFVALIDRIDSAADGHFVIDYKTSSTSLMQANTIKKRFINVDGAPDYRPKDFQMPLYLIAARAAGYDPVELVYYWLSQTDADERFKRSGLRVGEDGADFLSPEEMTNAEDNIIAVVERIASGFFEPDPLTPYECSRCAFSGVCSKGEEDSEDG